MRLDMGALTHYLHTVPPHAPEQRSTDAIAAYALGLEIDPSNEWLLSRKSELEGDMALER